MAILDLQTVATVRSLKVSGFVAAETLALGNQAARNAARINLTKKLEEAAKTYAVVIHPRDVDFREEGDDASNGITVTAWWAPSPERVELQGGQRDGEELELAEWTPVITFPNFIGPSHEPDDAVPTPNAVLAYDYAGFNDHSRRFDYTLRQSR